MYRKERMIRQWVGRSDGRIVYNIIGEFRNILGILTVYPSRRIRSILTMLGFSIRKLVEKLVILNLRLSVRIHGNTVSCGIVDGGFRQRVQEHKVVIGTETGRIGKQWRPFLAPCIIRILYRVRVLVVHPRKRRGTSVCLMGIPFRRLFYHPLVKNGERIHFILGFPNSRLRNPASLRQEFLNEIGSLFFIGKKANSLGSLHLFFKLKFFDDLVI